MQAPAVNASLACQPISFRGAPPLQKTRKLSPTLRYDSLVRFIHKHATHSIIQCHPTSCHMTPSHHAQPPHHKPWRSVDTPQRRSNLCIPRNEDARLLSQFPHSCICERIIYIPMVGPLIFCRKIGGPVVGI